MDGPAPLAAFLFALVVGSVALVDVLLQGALDRQGLLLLAGGAAPVIAFGVLGLATRRRLGFSA